MTAGRRIPHTPHDRCPNCGGCERDPRGRGIRCHGCRFEGSDYFLCSREDRAGGARYVPTADAYLHKLTGPCDCGESHDGSSPPLPAPRPREGRRHGRRRPGQAAPGRVVAIYPYPDRDGALVYEVLKYQQDDGAKTFRQRRPCPDPATCHDCRPDDAGDRWHWNLDGVQRVLYRFPELVAALAADPDATVFVVEGEKDVDRLRALGLVATCNPEGAGKWRDHFAPELRGCRVVILPDNDAAGRRHADQVARSLSGIAAEVRILHLPRLPEHGDVSDFLDAGGTRAHLEDLAAVVPPWHPEPEPGAGAGAGAPLSDKLSDRGQGDGARLEQQLAEARATIAAQAKLITRLEDRLARNIRRARAAQKERSEYRRRCTYYETLHQRLAAALGAGHVSAQTRIVAIKLALELEYQVADGRIAPGEPARVCYGEPEPETPREEAKSGYSLAARSGCSPKTVSRATDELVGLGVVDKHIEDPVFRDGRFSRASYIIAPPGDGRPGLAVLDGLVGSRPADMQGFYRRRPQLRCEEHPEAPIAVTHTCTEGGEELRRLVYTPAPIRQKVALGSPSTLSGQSDGQPLPLPSPPSGPPRGGFRKHRACPTHGETWHRWDTEADGWACMGCAPPAAAAAGDN